MPKLCSIDSTEMEYIDGGGKYTILKGSTIAGAAALGYHNSRKRALMPAITALSVSILLELLDGNIDINCTFISSPKIISVVCGNTALIDGNVKEKFNSR